MKIVCFAWIQTEMSSIFWLSLKSWTGNGGMKNGKRGMPWRMSRGMPQETSRRTPQEMLLVTPQGMPWGMFRGTSFGMLRKCLVFFYRSWIVIDNKELSYTAEASLEKHLLSLRGNPVCSLRHSLRHFPMVPLGVPEASLESCPKVFTEAFSRLFLHSSFRVLKIASICH